MHTSTCPFIDVYMLNVFCVKQIANPAPERLPERSSTCRRRDQHRKRCADKQGPPRYGSVSLHAFLLRHHCPSGLPSAQFILRLLPTWIGSMPRKPANLEKGFEDSSGPSAMLHIQLAGLSTITFFQAVFILL